MNKAYRKGGPDNRRETQTLDRLTYRPRIEA